MNKSNFGIKNIKQLFILMFLFIWLVFSGGIFLIQMTENEVDQFEQMMQAAAQNNANAVEMSFSKYISLLNLACASYKSSSSESNYFRHIASQLVRMDDFSYITLVLPKPKSSAYILPEGVLPVELDFTEKMLSKQIFISEVYNDKIINKPAVSINVPIKDENGSLEGYIVGVLSTTILSQNFSKIFYDLEGYFNIVDSNGNYLAASDSEDMLFMDITFFEAIDLVTVVKGYDANDVRKAFTERTQGMVRYYSEDVERAGYYSPIKINNWIIFLVVPESLIEEGVWSDFRPISFLVFNISCIFIILLILVYHSQRELTRFAEASEKNFRFMSEQTNKCIVELNFKEENVKITGKLNELFAIDANVATISCKEFYNMLVSDDIASMQTQLKNLEKGLQINDIKIRLSTDNKNFTWCSFSAVPILMNDNQMCVVAIGFLENIHEQEEEAALLRKMAELDSLTQVYNKGTTEAIIQKIIYNSEINKDKHTLLVVDLDNFKKLNDTFGHQYGDKVIKEMALSLSSLFRKSDIVGRIGGDEFFVFMRDIPSEKFIIDKCNEVQATLAKTFYNNEEYEISDNAQENQTNEECVEVSASIGVAIYPIHGEDFASLYQNADLALYSAKSSGKNNYKFFDAAMNTENNSNL